MQAGASGSYRLAPLIDSFAVTQPDPCPDREAWAGAAAQPQPAARPETAALTKAVDRPPITWPGSADYEHSIAAVGG